MIRPPPNSPPFPSPPLFRFYYLGSCYRNLNRPADAARLWEQAAEQGGEVAQAASLRLAELHVESGQRKAVLPCGLLDRKSTRLNSSHLVISYAVFCLKKKTV